MKISLRFGGLGLGIFITMEGIDGAGKTTQIELLFKYLEGRGLNVLKTREPGGTEISEQIRNMIIDINNSEMSPMTEALLYAAARAQLITEVIKPSLAQGVAVICDRFIDSSIVYQGIARGLGKQMIANINRFALSGLMPDITFFLDLPPEMSFQRKGKTEQLDRIETQMDYKRVYSGYIELAKEDADRIKVIDASRDKDTVHGEIVKYVDMFLMGGYYNEACNGNNKR